MDKELIVAIALGIGLAASAGFRVFVPMLVASVSAHLGIFPAQEGFQWLGSWAAMICFGTATIVEILAYYIPFVDNLLDSISTPLAIGTGTLLMTSVLPIDNDMLKWLTGFIVGGGIAATVQGGSIITRLLSTKLTAGTGNNIVASGENAAAVGTSILTLLAPFIVVAFLILLLIFFLVVFRKKLSRKKREITQSPRLT